MSKITCIYCGKIPSYECREHFIKEINKLKNFTKILEKKISDLNIQNGIEHIVLFRPGHKVKIILPEDSSEKELDRLGLLIKTFHFN